jgi:hypothetical protein
MKTLIVERYAATMELCLGRSGGTMIIDTYFHAFPKSSIKQLNIPDREKGDIYYKKAQQLAF